MWPKEGAWQLLFLWDVEEDHMVPKSYTRKFIAQLGVAMMFGELGRRSEFEAPCLGRST